MKNIYFKVIFLLCLCVNYINLFSQKINSSSIYTDGYVTTMADDSNNVYVGGRFSSVGHKARSISLLDTLGLKEFNFPSLTSGFAYAVVPDMNGGWYLGGNFEMEGVKNLVHILSNHKVDQNFRPTPIGAISSLVLDGNRLIIGGGFTQICNVDRQFLAAVDALTGKLLDWNPQPNGSINTLLKSGNKLYLSGAFSQIGNGLSMNFGIVDLVTGKNIPSISTNRSISAMDQDSLNVYIAGEFTGAQGFVTGSSALFSDSLDTPINFPVITSPANFVSKCKIKTAIPDGFGGWIIGGMFEYKGIKHVVHIKANGEVDTLINLRFNGFNDLIVNTLVLKGTTLYIGGSFSRVNEFTRNNLLAIDVITGKILDWNPNSSGPIYSMLLDSNSMYVGGNFSTMGYKTNPNFARIDINTGALLPSLAMSAPVNSMVKSNDKLYVGGNFENQGLYTGSLALMSSKSDVPNFNFSTLTGKVNCVISDKKGGWYVGGDFKNQNIQNLIHILPNNRIDSLFNTEPGGEIKTLSLYKDALYAGGNFSFIGGIQSPYFVKLDLITGKAIPTNIDVDGPVNAIAFSGDTLYVGGIFKKFGTCSTSNFAIMDMISGRCLSETYLNGQVNFLEQNKSQVFLGGKFFGYQGLKSGSLASYPINSDKFSSNFPIISGSIEKIISDQNGGWYLGGKFSVDDKANLIHVLSNNTIDPSFTSYTVADINSNHIIYDLVLDNDRLIVGGNFTMIAGQQQSNLAALNRNTGDLLNWKPNVNAMVKSVVIDNNVMYVGGDFTQFNGENANYFVKVDKNNLSVLPSVQVNSAVTCIQQDQSTIYVGGFFKGVSGNLTGSLTRNYAFSMTKATGEVTAWNPSLNGYVNCITISGNSAYIGGDFNLVGDSSRVKIAQVNLTSGEATSWKTNLNGDVYTITTIDTLVYVGGNFDQVASKNKIGIAAISSNNGNILSDWSPNPGGKVKSVVYLNNRIFLAGEFSYSNANNRSFVMAFAKNNLKVSTWNPSPNNTVHALDVHDNHAYIGGEFTNLNGTYSAYIAKVNLTDGNQMQFSVSVDGAVQGIKHTSNSVYLVGNFKSMNSKPLANIGSFNIQNETVNYNWLPNPNGLVTKFISDDTTLFMTGNFDYLKSSNIKYLVASSIQNQTIDTWNPQVSGYVNALEIDKSSLYFAGSFETVMNQNRKGFAEISLSNGKLSSFDPKFNSSCTTLKLAAGKLYIGGTFSAIGTINQKFVASFDIATKSLITKWNPKPNFYVSAFNHDGKNLLLVGEFTYFKTEYRDRLMSISKSTGLINPWSPKVSALVRTLKVGTNSVYIGGEFQSVSDKERNFLAEIKLSDAQATDWNPSSFRSVNAMEIVGDKVYVAGEFQSIGNQERNYLAAISRKSGQVLNWNPSAGGKVLQISHANNKFLVTGEFQSMNNVSRSSLFAFSKRTGRITSFNPKAFSTVEVIEPSDSSIYIGGTISKVGTIDVGNIAEIDIKTSLLTDWRPVINNKVTGIKKWKNKIFLSGNFDVVAGNYQPFLAALDAKTAKLIDWKPNPSDVVNKMHISDSTLYIGGNFKTISSQNRSYISSYNLTDLSLTNWNPSLDNEVSEITSTNSNIYIGGSFSYVDAQKRSMIASFDKKLGLLTPWSTELNRNVKSIEVSDNKVYCTAGDNYYSIDPLTGILDDYSLNFSYYLTALKRVDSTMHIGGTFSSLNTGNFTSDLYGGFLTLTLHNEKIVPPSIQLQSITPSVVGRGGVIGMTLTGQNFNRNGLFVRFSKNGQAPIVIPSSKLKIIDSQKILFSLELPSNVDLGQWNVEVVIPNDTVVALDNGLTIQEFVLGQVKSSIVGFKNIRPNVWQNYSLIVSNTGNTDVKGLPVYIAVDSTVSLKLNSKLVVNNSVNGLNLVDSVLSVTRIDSLFGEGKSYNVYSLLIANLPGSTFQTINFKLLTTSMSPFKVVTWNNDPIFDISLKKSWKDCVDGVSRSILAENSVFLTSSCGLNALNSSISTIVSESEFNFAKNGNKGGYISDYMYSFYDGMSSCGENQPLELSKKLFTKLLTNKTINCEALLMRNEDQLDITVVNSMDPNEKQGLIGKGIKKFIFGNELLPYIIRFENKATSSAPAQKVVIIDTIDLKVFDAKTLNLGAFEIGERMVSIPNGLQSYSTIVDFKKEKNILLGLDISFDPTSGQLKWIFTSLDSISKQETTNPTLGFLPPNLKSPEGEGAVSFTIKLLDNTVASQEVKNKAHIYFDNNSVITTNTWCNTIDNKAPISKVNEIVRDGNSKTFNLTWTAKDDESGVRDIDVYYAVNNGNFKLYATGVKASSLMFTGDKDSTYSFFTIATDSMGNIEKMKNYVEASTSITLGLNELLDDKNIKLSVFPNPTEGIFNLELTSPLFLPSSISIFDIYGKEIVKDKITLQKGLNSFSYTIENAGFYLIQVTIGNKTYRTQLIKS